ncbi:MAG: hypothetical protein GWN07_21965, partial [Actinobacteria bacterium]|nr:hypothetical protein [Actinomycetota bacterium]NIS33147.1 hypothetical protein [Actinomycetota bacterium]NIU68064.1 hypothetical protein [Actinomycetota bacterium]NIW29853.1 hypothetical protein [Actinomycetota bacterium]NIX22352.1 hypothetical protein [Actinomycetota bacterium]
PSRHSGRVSTTHGGSFDVPGIVDALPELRAAAAAPDLWDDQPRALEVTRRLARYEGIVERVDRLGGGIDDAEVLLDLADEESDTGAAADVIAELTAIDGDLADL